MVPAFLTKPFLDMASSVWAMPEEQWILDAPSLEDTNILKNEASQGSGIDEVNFRQQVVDQWMKKEVQLKVNVLPGRTRVVFLGTDEQFEKVPWGLWSRIFQAIGHPVKRVLFYAHSSERFYPTKPKTIQAENINGGYTHLCLQEKIVIYRFEEASRVLLHELLHTACLDKEKDVVSLEAHTEAWTEIFLCAILSKGHPRTFASLWLKQCLWIKHQCSDLKETWSINGPDDYPWRYIVGKRDVLEGLGFLLKCSGSLKVPLGLRFTTPEWPL